MEISINGIEYTNSDQAKKALQAERRKEERERKIKEERTKKAKNASEHAYWKITHYIGLLLDDNNRKSDLVRYRAIYQTKYDRFGKPNYCITYIAEGGNIEYDHIGFKPIQIIDGFSGNLAVELEDTDTKKRTWSSLGIHENESWFSLIPCFISAYFEELFPEVK